MAATVRSEDRTGTDAGDGARRRGLLAALSLSTLSASLAASVASVALPVLAQAFDATFQSVQWIVLAYLLALTALIVSAGRLGDMIGRRRLLLLGLAAFTGASLLCAGAPSLWVLIIARAAQGVGAAVMTALALAFVADAVPAHRAGAAMGLIATMSAIGTALGPALGGVLIETAGWRALFLVGAPLGLLTLGLAWRSLPDDGAAPRADRARFDGVGALLLAMALVAYALAMTAGAPGRHGLGTREAMLLLTAAVCLGLFVRVEARVAAPLIPLALFRDRRLDASLVMNALVSAVMMTTLVVGPFHLSRGLGLAATEVGLVLSVGPVVSALSGVLAGRIVDRLGAGRVVLVGLGVMAAGAILLAVLAPWAGLVGYVAAIVILTPGYQLFQAANNTAVMGGVDAGRRGLVSGVLGLSRNLGLVTGASAMGAVFVFATGSATIMTAAPAAVSHGVSVTFMVAAGLIGIALGAACIGRRTPNASQRAGEASLSTPAAAQAPAAASRSARSAS